LTETISLDRNFLHAAELEFAHPISGEALQLKAALPTDLETFLKKLKQ
jgi:23S rRNA pseudouridine1911/1915/1917 synthase